METRYVYLKKTSKQTKQIYPPVAFCERNSFLYLQMEEPMLSKMKQEEINVTKSGKTFQDFYRSLKISLRHLFFLHRKILSQKIKKIQLEVVSAPPNP